MSLADMQIEDGYEVDERGTTEELRAEVKRYEVALEKVIPQFFNDYPRKKETHRRSAIVKSATINAFPIHSILFRLLERNPENLYATMRAVMNAGLAIGLALADELANETKKEVANAPAKASTD